MKINLVYSYQVLGTKSGAQTFVNIIYPMEIYELPNFPIFGQPQNHFLCVVDMSSLIL